MIAFITYIR